MIDVSNLSIAEQKLIIETTLMLTVALQALGQESQTDSQVLEEKLRDLVNKKLSKMSDEDIRQNVKQFFHVNANRNLG